MPIAQCRELFDRGVPGIHFYTLSRLRATVDMLEAMKKRQGEGEIARGATLSHVGRGSWRCYAARMGSHAIKARIDGARVIVNEKIDLPDGEIYLVPAEIGEERAHVEQVIEESIVDEKAGRVEDFFV